MNNITDLLTNANFFIVVFFIGIVLSLRRIFWIFKNINQKLDDKRHLMELKETKENKQELFNEKFGDAIKETAKEYSKKFQPSQFWQRLQLIIALIAAIGFGYFFIFKTTTHDYVKTTCTVADKKLTEDHDWYSAALLLNYQVGSDGYKEWNSGAVRTKGTTSPALKELNQYTIGKAYPCWYSNGNPHTVTLDSSIDVLYFIFGAIILVILGSLWSSFRGNKI